MYLFSWNILLHWLDGPDKNKLPKIDIILPIDKKIAKSVGSPCNAELILDKEQKLIIVPNNAQIEYPIILSCHDNLQQ